MYRYCTFCYRQSHSLCCLGLGELWNTKLMSAHLSQFDYSWNQVWYINNPVTLQGRRTDKININKRMIPVVLCDHQTPFLQPKVTNWASQWAINQNVSALASTEGGPPKSPQHCSLSVCYLCMCLHGWTGIKRVMWPWSSLCVQMKAFRSWKRTKRGKRSVREDARWHSRDRAGRMVHTGTHWDIPAVLCRY